MYMKGYDSIGGNVPKIDPFYYTRYLCHFPSWVLAPNTVEMWGAIPHHWSHFVPENLFKTHFVLALKQYTEIHKLKGCL